MAITLNPQTQRRIEEQMRDGTYQSPDELVQAALALLERRDRENREALTAVREKVRIGLEQLDRGETVDGEAAFEQLLAELDQDGGTR